MQRLPLFATLAFAYRYVWQKRKDFFAFAYLPVLANTLVNLPLQLSLPKPIPTDPQAFAAVLTLPVILLWIVSLAVAIGFYIVFAIAWHRQYLLPGETTTIGQAIRWRRRHWRFFTVVVLMGLAFTAASFAVPPLVILLFGAVAPGAANAPAIAAAFAFLLIATLFMRFLPVFPAIAVDDAKVTFNKAWTMTRGNGATLFTLIFMTSLSVGLAWLLSQFALAPLIGSFLLAGSVLAIFCALLVNQILTFIGVALTTSIASIAYETLKDGGTGRSPTSPV